MPMTAVPPSMPVVPPKDSLVYRFLVLALAVYAVVMVAAASFHMWNQYHDARRSVIVELERVGSATAKSMALAIYTVDTAQVEAIISGVDATAVIEGIVVHRQFLDPIYSGRARTIMREIKELDVSTVATEAGVGVHFAGPYFWVEMPLVHEDVDGSTIRVGSVSLFSTNQIVLDQVWAGFQFILLVSLLQLVVLGAVYLWLSRRFLSRPLTELSGAISLVTADNLGTARVRTSGMDRGEIRLLTAAFNDMIGRLHESQVALERAEDKYRSMVENAVEGIFQTSVEGAILSANPAMLRILGYDSMEQLGEFARSVEELYVDLSEREKVMDKLNREGWVRGYELEMRRRDGSSVWVSASVRLVRDEHGEPILVEGIGEDISVRREMENALRRAKEEAEALSQMKSSFLSTVSHELRTPLTSILGFVKINGKLLQEVVTPMLDGVEDEKGRAVLRRMAENEDIVMSECRRLTGLINNVLDLSRLESGGMEWNMAEVDVREILRRALASMEVLALEAEVRLSMSVDRDVPAVCGDQDRLMQGVLNLLSNALKFMNPGGTISCTAVHDNGQVRVSVADTGVGIPLADLESVFDKFKQLGDTLSSNHKGSGLGLPICKEIVEYHGGRIWVESMPGQGSVFSFTLPVYDG